MTVVAVLDSNAVDALLDQPDLSDRVAAAVDAGVLRLLYTHVTVDELAQVPDDARRADLLSLLTAYAFAVPTGDFALGASRLGMARISGEDSPIDALRSSAGRHTLDALVAGTARQEGALLVTYERRLTNRARAAGITAVTWDVLLGRLPAE